MVMPEGIIKARTAKEWHEQNDRVWDEKESPHNPAFTRTHKGRRYRCRRGWPARRQWH